MKIIIDIKSKCGGGKKRGCSFDDEGLPYGILKTETKHVRIERPIRFREAA